MKTRLSLIFATLVILLGAMIWVIQDRRSETPSPLMASSPALTYPAAPSAQRAIDPAAVDITARVALPPAVSGKTAPMVRVAASGDVKYVARAGDTVSQLAIALLGSDSKDHRDAVIAANPSLQENPDRVLEGQTYSIQPASGQAAKEAAIDQRPAVVAIAAERLPAAATAESPEPVAPKIAEPAEGRKLTYVAQPGDTVGVLAANLLGGDTKANRDTIVASNPPLQQDPDHLVAGQKYTINAPNGLAVDPTAVPARLPTTQPDADDVTRLSVGRSLRYTAVAGDSVSRLATELLGSDTPANRDLIIRSNPSLKADPDHLVAGKTYWINAPTP